MNKSIKRYKIQFYGIVQGVGFRYTATQFAKQLGLTGWVHNEMDGSVLCEVQGKDRDIDQFIELMHEDHYIQIDRYTKYQINIKEEYAFKYRF